MIKKFMGNKIDKRRNYYAVIDVETCGAIGSPLCYDIGFAITDKQGNIYETYSYVVSEIFWGERALMGKAYYANKLPQYINGIYNTNEWICKSIYYIKTVFNNACVRYGVEAVCAYNASFDVRALKSTMTYITNDVNAEFLELGLPIYDIWSLACQTICKTDNYIGFCMNNSNECISNANNMKTNAETVYGSLIDNITFEESHTGLEDAIIESQILAEVLKRKKNRLDFSILPLPWKIPQDKYHACLNPIP